MDKSQRDTVVRRDGFRCQACGRRTRGQVHHIFGRGQGGSDSLANLVTLCGRCHMLVSPIPVAELTAYFKVSEEELLVRRARVEVAIHSWVLGTAKAAAPEPIPCKVRPRFRTSRVPSPKLVPEWKRLRPRAGRVWDSAEDVALLADFDAGLPLEEIAARRGRGVFSVEVRLCKLGRLSPRPSVDQSATAEPVAGPCVVAVTRCQSHLSLGHGKAKKPWWKFWK